MCIRTLIASCYLEKMFSCALRFIHIYCYRDSNAHTALVELSDGSHVNSGCVLTVYVLLVNTSLLPFLCIFSAAPCLVSPDLETKRRLVKVCLPYLLLSSSPVTRNQKALIICGSCHLFSIWPLHCRPFEYINLTACGNLQRHLHHMISFSTNSPCLHRKTTSTQSGYLPQKTDNLWLTCGFAVFAAYYGVRFYIYSIT